MSQAATLPDVPGAPGKPRRSRLLVIGLAGGLFIGVAAAAAYWFFGGVPPAEAKMAKVEEPGGLVPFETFLVNLADNRGQAYLRVTLKLLMADEKQAERIAGNEVAQSRIRNAILETLAMQSAGRLVTAQGKAELKQALLTQISELTRPVEVRDVLYADFVIQF
ncbi:MAG: flagellar basal body-associated FliL family protein [Acidobacteriota bacterium]